MIITARAYTTVAVARLRLVGSGVEASGKIWASSSGILVQAHCADTEHESWTVMWWCERREERCILRFPRSLGVVASSARECMCRMCSSFFITAVDVLVIMCCQLVQDSGEVPQVQFIAAGERLCVHTATHSSVLGHKAVEILQERFMVKQRQIPASSFRRQWWCRVAVNRGRVNVMVQTTVEVYVQVLTLMKAWVMTATLSWS